LTVPTVKWTRLPVVSVNLAARFFSTSTGAAEVKTLMSADADGRIPHVISASAVADQTAGRLMRLLTEARFIQWITSDHCPEALQK
jgi:hypothetical protein